MDYLKLISKFQNKWVALDKSRTKVLATDKSLSSLSKKVKKLRDKDIVLSFIQDENKRYAPWLL